MNKQTIIFEKLKQRFADYLRKYQYRNTQERYLVLDNIVAIDKHFNADELYVFMRTHNIKISRATIYSTLDLLTKCEILTKHHFQGDSAHFELADKMPNHDHLICVECGRIIEFQEQQLDSISNEITAKFGFKPISHSFQIFAVCPDIRTCEYNKS